MARHVLFATLLLSSAGGVHYQPAHQQSHRQGHAAECDTTCAHMHVPPRPHGLAHSPGTCSVLSLERLRCTAVVAAEDFSDPAYNADLDKPKTLLPHSDVEPSSMMLQPAGEGEPTRMPSAADPHALCSRPACPLQPFRSRRRAC